MEPRGLTRHQFDDLVSGLRTGGGRIDPASFPSGYDVDARDDLVQPNRDTWTFDADFESVGGHGPLHVHAGHQSFVDSIASHLGDTLFQLDVDGQSRPAAWMPATDGPGKLTISVAEGLVVSIDAHDLQRAKEIGASLRRVQDDVRDVAAGFECGIVLQNYADIKEGDQLEVYETRQVERTLS